MEPFNKRDDSRLFGRRSNGFDRLGKWHWSDGGNSQRDGESERECDDGVLPVWGDDRLWELDFVCERGVWDEPCRFQCSDHGLDV